ncbi:hypothetical protein M5D96_009156 [Drosophila gunungcola]|uniref:Uncharacterized protein n=1 Tax=Drosophila gunungcola TaxID=103775 RepID=A0A9P9YK10_9MUSC|nr:hypothetical protein M5D96_009156 [Drosophila gunungcola]
MDYASFVISFVLSVLFYNIRQVKLTLSESANLVTREFLIFWEKARIPTRALPNCVKKLIDLYQAWRELQKNCKSHFQGPRKEF